VSVRAISVLRLMNVISDEVALMWPTIDALR
jgi:hypothetical protein